MTTSDHGSRILQGLGIALGVGGLAAAVVFPGQAEPALMNSAYSLLILGGVLIFLRGRPLSSEAPSSPGSHGMIVAGLVIGAVAALVTNGVLMPPSADSKGVYGIGVGLLLVGLGLVHRGRATAAGNRQVVGYVVFAASVGAASLLFYKRAQGLSLLALPIGAVGVWAALVLALGSAGTRGAASSAG